MKVTKKIKSMSPKTNKKTKMTLILFSNKKQMYYKFEKEKIKLKN
jgi:hypothetical protein